MKRTKRRGTLFAAYDSRVLAAEALGAIANRKDASSTLGEAAAALSKAAAALGDSVVRRRYAQFGALLSSLRHLLRWGQAVRSAELEADRHRRAAAQIASDLLREIAAEPDGERLSEAAFKIIAISAVDEIEQIAGLLLHIPLPLPLFAKQPWRPGPAKVGPEVVESPDVSVAFVSFALNDIAFGDPHTVEPEVLHDLSVEVRVSHWPKEAEELVLDVISVEPPDVYQLPRFSFGRPGGEPPYILRKTGRMLLRVPQALLSRPLEFAYRAWFVPEISGTRVTVEGQRHLRVQSYDPEVNPQTGYKEVDRRLLDIRTQVRSKSTVRDEELGNFLQILGTLGRIAGQALQDDLFPRGWSESTFQAEIKKLIRSDPRIGSELEEHPRAAGGITDLSSRGIRIELKVVSDQYVTLGDAQRFLNQTTQYVAGSDRRLGIQCLLDCSEKNSAPGAVANDINLLTVPPPSGGANLPILVGVVIIRGNLPTPSSLSKGR